MKTIITDNNTGQHNSPEKQKPLSTAHAVKDNGKARARKSVAPTDCFLKKITEIDIFKGNIWLFPLTTLHHWPRSI